VLELPLGRNRLRGRGLRCSGLNGKRAPLAAAEPPLRRVDLKFDIRGPRLQILQLEPATIQAVVCRKQVLELPLIVGAGQYVARWEVPAVVKREVVPRLSQPA